MVILATVLLQKVNNPPIQLKDHFCSTLDDVLQPAERDRTATEEL